MVSRAIKTNDKALLRTGIKIKNSVVEDICCGNYRLLDVIQTEMDD